MKDVPMWIFCFIYCYINGVKCEPIIWAAKAEVYACCRMSVHTHTHTHTVQWLHFWLDVIIQCDSRVHLTATVRTAATETMICCITFLLLLLFFLFSCCWRHQRLHESTRERLKIFLNSDINQKQFLCSDNIGYWQQGGIFHVLSYITNDQLS